MNKQDAKAVRLILSMAADSGLLKREVADEVAQNSHIFLRKNHWRWKLQRFESRLRDIETAQQEVARLLSSLGLAESAIAKIATRHNDLAIQLKNDIASAIEAIDVELPPDPTRVPSQDASPPPDDPDGLALGQFERDSAASASEKGEDE